MQSNKSGNLSDVKKHNCKIIFELLKKSTGMTLLEIERSTGLSRPTTVGVVRALENANLVIKVGKKDSRGGRIPLLYGINPDAYYAIGIDFEYPASRVAIGDMKGMIQYRSGKEFAVGLTAKEAIEQLVTQINELIRESGIERDRLLGIGLGIPGYINLKSGMSLYFERITDWKDIDIRQILRERTGLPVFMENDVHLLYRAEHGQQAEASQRDTLFIAIRSGIGMAIFQRGHLMEGEFGNSGHIGHIVVQADGPQCRCGNRGCLELYCGEQAIVSSYQSLTGELVDSVAVIVERAQKGCTKAAAVLAQAGRYLGIGIGNVINLLDVNRIIVSARFDSQLMLETARNEVEERINHIKRREIEICASGLAEADFALGGCRLVFHRCQQEILDQVQFK